jgi:hypothetical protein
MMREPMVLIAPVPHIWLPEDSPPYLFPPYLAIEPMTPELRRVLLNTAKQHECSEHTLRLTLESDTVAVTPVPLLESEKISIQLADVCYRGVADSMMRRFLDCVRLFMDLPAPFIQYIWFACLGEIGNLDMATMVPTHPTQTLEGDEANFEAVTPDWFWGSQHSHSIPTSKEDDEAFEKKIKSSNSDLIPLVASELMSRCLSQLQDHWEKLSKLCLIQQLVETYTDPKKRQSYIDAANANVVKRAEDRVRLLAREKARPESPIEYKIPPEENSEWFIMGYVGAFVDEIWQVDQKLYRGRGKSQPRFARAFQIFADSVGLKQPHHFISLMTCLESLLCTSNAELGYQLASRVAWLLSDEDADARIEQFDEMKRLYGLRSKVVHGDRYDFDDLFDETDALLRIVRRLMLRILGDSELDLPFLSSDSGATKALDNYLKRLSLGALTREQ